MTEVVDATGEGRDQAVQRAADALRTGGLAVVPTDTAYAVVADAFSLAATGRVFTARAADRRHPLTVLVRSPKQLAGLTTIVPEVAERLVAAYWPGPLTLLIPAEPNLRWDLGVTEGTVAVRMPLDDLALEVVRAVGPLAHAAAGRAGDEPVTSAAQAVERLGDEVAVVLDDGPRGDATVSTVVDLTRREPVVVRAGVLPAEEVLAVARGEVDPFRVGAAPDGAPDRPAAVDEPGRDTGDAPRRDGGEGSGTADGDGPDGDGAPV
jgi:L-threonylcarbamoyladenylate synthase